MQFERTRFEGLVVVHPERHNDQRGYFTRLFCEEEFAREGLVHSFPQSSLSYNVQAGTVRGMHYQQAPNDETKLVSCRRGMIFDVLVDLRPDQPTYLQWAGFELSPDDGRALYVPTGFAHGFQTLKDDSEVGYAITPKFVRGAGYGVRWNDPAINVNWPLPVSVISARDCGWPLVGNSAL